MKSAMDRPPCDSGFTLVEMLLVLLLLSVLLLVTPLLKRQQRILLRMDVQQIREICTKAQAQAIREHKSIPIKIQGSKVYCNREILFFCSRPPAVRPASFHYTAQGTISKAFTLNCRSASSTVQLVAQLGSGRMDVR
ncbi:MAG: competence type IV pilus minor pilin ComGD [[Clostridium] innocuum]